MPEYIGTPYRQFRFRVEIDGITQAGFKEVSFADTTIDPVEYREGTDPTYVAKLSGLTKYGNVTLKWGITDSMDLFNWYNDCQKEGANKHKKKVSIILIDEEGNDKNRWNLIDCWPTKYDPPDFNAQGNEVAIESLDLVCYHYERAS